MPTKILAMMLFFSLALPLRAQTIAVNPDSPEQYVVQKGDTLWGIAGRFLAEPWRWPEIWKVNPQVEDPNLIYPGDVISLSYDAAGEPVLSLERDGEGAELGDELEIVTQDRSVKLSPAVRSHDRTDAIPAIPIDAIQHFLYRPKIVNVGEMATWPYVVSSYEEHLIAGTGNKIYIRDLPAGAAGSRYSIYRQGPAYKNKAGEVLAYESLYVGDVAIERDGDPATGIILQAEREVLNGDRLVLQSEEAINTDFIPRPPGSAVQGHIISVVDGLSQIGQYQVVVLDLGQSSGLEVGNVLGVYQSGRVINDTIKGGQEDKFGGGGLAAYLGTVKRPGARVELPAEYVGVLLVFRTFRDLSYALVMETNAPLHLYDEVRNL